MNKKAISIFLAAAMTCSILADKNLETSNVKAEEMTTQEIAAEPASTAGITEEPTTTPGVTVSPAGITAGPASSPGVTEGPAEPATTPGVTAEPATGPEIQPTEVPEIASAPAIKSENEYTFKKTGNKVTLKALVKKDNIKRNYKDYVYKWYIQDKTGKKVSLEGKEQKKAGYKVSLNSKNGTCSLVIPKNKPSKAGTYKYICEVSSKAGNADKKQCKFNVVVYKPAVSINWGSSKTIDQILGTGKIFGSKKKITVEKITVANKKYSKNISSDNKNKSAKLSIKKWFKGKAQVKFTVKPKNSKRETLNIAVSAKIPDITYKAYYLKKRQSLKIKMDSFAIKNIKHIYIMAKGQRWNTKGFKLDTLTFKTVKSKRTIIIPGFTNVIKKVELKFMPNKKSAYSKAWSHNEKSKMSKVKCVKK